tara:strand:- start:188 stop:295 length:108 start_codon:yes stop_codon:yes gene_type:complete
MTKVERIKTGDSKIDLKVELRKTYIKNKSVKMIIG